METNVSQLLKSIPFAAFIKSNYSAEDLILIQ